VWWDVDSGTCRRIAIGLGKFLLLRWVCRQRRATECLGCAVGSSRPTTALLAISPRNQPLKELPVPVRQKSIGKAHHSPLLSPLPRVLLSLDMLPAAAEAKLEVNGEGAIVLVVTDK